jgi:FHS family glucose/mannose:H+ symporter-like MFS transporter
MPAAVVRPHSRSAELPLPVLFAGFALCGLATVLLGPLLPAMSDRWGMADAQTGLLFPAQFISATLTAILSPWRLRYSLVSGYALLAAGMLTLTFANYPAAIAAFSLIGLGIGLSVTATNLLIGSSNPSRRGNLLTQSNFFWAAGAVACAPLVGLAERQHQMRAFLFLAAAAMAVTAVILLPLLRQPDGDTAASSPRQNSQTTAPPPIGVFLLFALIMLLYVGTENSIGGWITEYSHRFLCMSAPRASLMALLFWISLLAGRAISSWLLKLLPENTVLLPATIAAMAGTLLLLSHRATTTVTAAAVIAGLGCGPVFPLLMSRLFARTGDSRHNGWVFAISGGGGAILPWLTGLVSTHSGSLRTAFLVPLTALTGILIFVLSGRNRPIRQAQSKAFQR